MKLLELCTTILSESLFLVKLVSVGLGIVCITLLGSGLLALKADK